jgi:hypothetical protein
MGGRKRGQQRLVPQRVDTNAVATGRRRSPHHHRGRQLVAGDLPQQFRSHVLLEPDLELRMLALYFLHDPRRLQPRERGVADPEKTALGLRRATRVLDCSIDLGKRPPRPLEQRRASRCQLHPARCPHEEHQPQVPLELANRTRERRLRHVQMLRRASEMQLLRDGDEIAQLSQLERNIHRRGY